MKKQEIYVPIANKKEAKRAKAVLEAMVEVCSERFYIGNETGLWYYEEEGVWSCCQEGGNNYGNKTKITLKQLIELLVSEQQAEPEKIAVRVDNEKEFNALMKYYDSLGWKSAGKHNPLDLNFDGDNYVSYHHMFYYTRQYELKDYKIIPFSEFAKEHGIRVPLLVSEDGVELFEGDLYTCVYKHEGAWHKGVDGLILKIDNNCVENPQESKAFSTPQSALDWIEAQKPKDVEVKLFNNKKAILQKGCITIIEASNKAFLTPSDLEGLIYAYKHNFLLATS